MAPMQRKSLNAPDEEAVVSEGHAGTGDARERNFWPGYVPAWLEVVGILEGRRQDRELSGATHQLPYLGRLRVRMDDGAQAEFGPGDVSVLPPGHDAWVIGNEPAVVMDITGMTEYAKTK